jgi:hypothetical protein
VHLRHDWGSSLFGTALVVVALLVLLPVVVLAAMVMVVRRGRVAALRISSRTEKVVEVAGDPATIGWTMIRDAITRGRTGDLSRMLVPYRIFVSSFLAACSYGLGSASSLSGTNTRNSLQ